MLGSKRPFSHSWKAAFANLFHKLARLFVLAQKLIHLWNTRSRAKRNSALPARI